MNANEIDVPEHASPAGTCEFCDRPFPTADRLVLHKGIEHPKRLDSTEEKAFQEARAAEEEELGTLLLKSTAVLVLLYFGLLFTYAIVT